MAIKRYIAIELYVITVKLPILRVCDAPVIPAYHEFAGSSRLTRVDET